MCNKVVEWNAKEYDKIKANCQHFLDEVLGVMGIPIPTEGALGEALAKLKTDGIMQMSYKPPYVFGLPERTFRNHKQLDNFFDELLAACPNFRTAYPHDCALLKAYGTLFLFLFLFLFLSFSFPYKYSQPRSSLLANARERRPQRTRNGRTRAVRMSLQ